MHKVTTVNLNGTAYQVEEAAYTALHGYIETAKKALDHDPDQAEIIADLEQSIAEKCNHYVSGTKNVVTTKEMSEIISAMGPVETGEDNQTESAQSSPLGIRKLYRIREGAVFFGVCNGFAAALGIPVTVVRVLFVLLAVVTHGVWGVLYLIAAVVMPVADDEEKLATAYGKPITAQDVVNRAKERVANPDTLTHAGEAIMKVWRVIAKIVTIISSVVLAVLTAAWVMAQWVVWLNRAQFQGTLAGLNGWREGVFVTAVYLILAVPTFLIARLFNRVADERPRAKRTTVGEGSLVVLWIVAFATVLSLGVVYAQDVRNYVRTNSGYLDVGGHHLCVDHNLCDPQPDMRKAGRPILEQPLDPSLQPPVK